MLVSVTVITTLPLVFVTGVGVRHSWQSTTSYCRTADWQCYRLPGTASSSLCQLGCCFWVCAQSVRLPPFIANHLWIGLTMNVAYLTTTAMLATTCLSQTDKVGTSANRSPNNRSCRINCDNPLTDAFNNIFTHKVVTVLIRAFGTHFFNFANLDAGHQVLVSQDSPGKRWLRLEDRMPYRNSVFT